MKRIFCICLLLLSLAFSSCVPVALVTGAAVGIGGYKYFEGALTVIYNASFKKTWDASLGALEGVNLKIEEKGHGEASGKIKAVRSDNTVITVSMKYLSSDQTEVSIRVGLLGDEAESSVIRDKIGDALFK